MATINQQQNITNNEPSAPPAPSAVETSVDIYSDESDDDQFASEDVVLDLSDDEWVESDSDSDSDDDEDDFDFKAERARVLGIAAQQREVARWYLHPEYPVPSTLGARCFFDRGSAEVTWLNEIDDTAVKGIIDVEDEDDTEEWEQALADVATMKEVVSWFLHPERPVTTNGNQARCFFERDSAEVTWLNKIDDTAVKGVVDVEDKDERMEREQALAINAEMKEVVSWYMHPERPVTTNGNTARCFFGRASAPEQMDKDDADAMAECLADAAALKERASWHLHPERPVTTNGNTARCFFGRASAPEQMDKDDADAMAECLADAAALKERASWHLHPERPVTTNGNTARCFFGRASAPEQMDKDDADAMAECLADAAALKERASWYHHPSRDPIKVSATATARNYFQPEASKISTRRIRGESSIDQFEMEVEVGMASSCQEALCNFFGAIEVDTSGDVDPDESIESGDKEGNLSRSPSSVMLFEQAA